MSIYIGCHKGYRYDSTTDQCVICPQNTYSNTTNANTCIPCPRASMHDRLSNFTGLISDEGSTSRSDCGKHLFINLVYLHEIW